MDNCTVAPGLTLIGIYVYNVTNIMYKVKDLEGNIRYLMHRGMQMFDLPEPLPESKYKYEGMYKNCTDSTDDAIIGELVNIHNDTLISMLNSINEADGINNEVIEMAKACVITSAEIKIKEEE